VEHLEKIAREADDVLQTQYSRECLSHPLVVVDDENPARRPGTHHGRHERIVADAFIGAPQLGPAED
jgi:hypothetical protein